MAIGPIKTSEIKSRILQLAQTNVYQIKLSPPSQVRSHLSRNGVDYGRDGEDVELLCQSAFLPGSSLSTHEVVGDFKGVRERMAYRRQYDDNVDLTFYVDHDYKVIELFEGWVDFIAGQGRGQYLNDNAAVTGAANYQFNYPQYYKTNMYIVKFEKDVSTVKSVFEHDKTFQLTYTLVNAFPINIIQQPITYEGTNILKFQVSMAFDRYVVNKSRVRE